MKLTVMKFGGTSMGAADAILQCADVLISQYSEDDRVCAVVSAMSGVTDLLIRSAKAAASGDEAVFGEAQSVLEEKHRVALNALQASEESSQIVFKQIEEFASLCHAVYVLGEVTDRALDAITALGERMSIHLLDILAQFLLDLVIGFFLQNNFNATILRPINCRIIWHQRLGICIAGNFEPALIQRTAIKEILCNL